jgi:hypothetical protein
MRFFFNILISSFLTLFSVTVYAQEAEMVENALRKAVAQTKGSSVSIPLMDKSPAKKKLAKAVASSVDATLKSTRKTGLWTVQELSAEQIGDIALSGSPFTSLMEVKGEEARSEFNEILSNQLEKNQVFELMEDLERSEVINEVALGTLISLDRNGSRLLDNI